MRPTLRADECACLAATQASSESTDEASVQSGQSVEESPESMSPRSAWKSTKKLLLGMHRCQKKEAAESMRRAADVKRAQTL